MTFPEDCLQSIVEPDPWWEENKDKQLCRGAIVFAFLPYVDQLPYQFEPKGRTSATEHSKADVVVAPLKVNQPLKQVNLPVAAMVLHDKEVWAAYRAKKRPCLVLATEGISVDKSLTKGKPNHSTAPTILVAPFYGADEKGRAGYSDAFRERVRHCEYPQFHWDKLPISGSEESILRLDHIQPIGAHSAAYEVSKHRLSKSALSVLDDQLKWWVWGGLPEDSVLLAYQQLINEI